MRVVTRRAGIDIAMATEGKEMPFQKLLIGLESVPHLLLHRHNRGYISGAVQDNRRTAYPFCGLRGMERPHGGDGFVTHGWIVTDERAHFRRRRDEVNSDPTAHAVTADGDSLRVHMRL